MNTTTKQRRLLANLLLIGALGACSSSGGGDSGSSASGAVTFAKSYGGPAREQATAATPRPGGGYVFAGTWNNRGAGRGRIAGTDWEGRDGDFWVVALDEPGDIQWQRSYGRLSSQPPGTAARSEKFYEARAALDADGDGRSDGTWLVGRLGEDTDDDVANYRELDADLLITRLDANDQIVWSRVFDSGPFPNYPYAFADEQTSETETGWVGSQYIAPTDDGGAVAAVRATAVVRVNTDVEIVYGVYVVKVDTNGDVRWSTVLTFPDRRDDPMTIVVQGLPGGGAVVAYRVHRADQLRVVRIDPGPGTSASIRWERVFQGDADGAAFVATARTPTDLLPVDDDVDGTLDGVLIASEGTLRKLDYGDGTERWRVQVGRQDVRVATTCVTPAVQCNYVVLGRENRQTLVRTILRSSGGTVAERRFADSRFGQLRYRADLDQYQLLSGSAATIRLLDRTLNPVADAVLSEEIGFARIAPDIGGGYIALETDANRPRLRRIDAAGNVAPPHALRPAFDVTLERAFSVQALAGADGRADAGFVVAGSSRIPTAPATREDAWVLRLDASGNIVWQKRLNGFSMATRTADTFSASNDLLRVTGDGGFILGGNDGTSYGWVGLVKLTAEGDVAWTTPALAGDTPSLTALSASADGYLAGGRTYPGEFDMEGSWVARVDAAGGVLWRYGYSGFVVSDLLAAADGGALAVGRTSGSSTPSTIVVARLDADGGVRWARSYPFGQSAVFGSVRVAPSRAGYVLATTIQENAGDSVAPHNVLLVAIDDAGAVQWSQRYGGLYEETVHDIEPLADGGFLISAQSDSMGDYTEAWVLRVGPDGRVSEGCNADLGRGGAVARVLDIARRIVSASTAPAPVIAPAGTNVVANEPVGVVTARQCRGVATNNPGNIPNARTLTVNQAGSLSGVVTSLPHGIVCGTQGGGVCSAAFAPGILVTLRVDIGSVQDFQAWGAGCDIVRGNFGEICDVRMDADKTIGVVFGAAPPPPPPPGQFTLTVTVTQLGGFVGSTDGSFSCGVTGASGPRTCAVQYAAGTVVNLYAAALPGANVLLEAWAGDCASFDAQTSIGLTMNRDYTCGALFVPGPGS